LHFHSILERCHFIKVKEHAENYDEDHRAHATFDIAETSIILFVTMLLFSFQLFILSFRELAIPMRVKFLCILDIPASLGVWLWSLITHAPYASRFSITLKVILIIKIAFFAVLTKVLGDIVELEVLVV